MDGVIARTPEEVKEILLIRRRIDGNGCWLWTGSTSHGYGYISFQGYPHRVHRLAAHLWLGFDLASKLCVLHKDDCNRRCFNPDHLRIGTQSENIGEWRARKLSG